MQKFFNRNKKEQILSCSNSTHQSTENSAQTQRKNIFVIGKEKKGERQDVQETQKNQPIVNNDMLNLDSSSNESLHSKSKQILQNQSLLLKNQISSSEHRNVFQPGAENFKNFKVSQPNNLEKKQADESSEQSKQGESESHQKTNFKINPDLLQQSYANFMRNSGEVQERVQNKADDESIEVSQQQLQGGEIDSYQIVQQSQNSSLRSYSSNNFDEFAEKKQQEQIRELEGLSQANANANDIDEGDQILQDDHQKIQSQRLQQIFEQHQRISQLESMQRKEQRKQKIQEYNFKRYTPCANNIGAEKGCSGILFKYGKKPLDEAGRLCDPCFLEKNPDYVPETKKLTEQERRKQRHPRYQCSTCNKQLDPYRHKQLKKDGSGQCKTCLGIKRGGINEENEELQDVELLIDNNVDPKQAQNVGENPQFIELQNKKKRIEKGFTCIDNDCGKFQILKKADDKQFCNSCTKKKKLELKGIKQDKHRNTQYQCYFCKEWKQKICMKQIDEEKKICNTCFKNNQ